MPYDRIIAVNEDDEVPPAVKAALGIPTLTDILATTGTPAAPGTPTRGVSSSAARADHRHAATPLPSLTSAGLTAGANVDLIDADVYRFVGLFCVVNFLALMTDDKVADGVLGITPGGYRPSHIVYGTFANSTTDDAISVYLETSGNIKTNVAIPDGAGVRGQLVFMLG